MFLKDLDDGKFAENHVRAILGKAGLPSLANESKSRQGLLQYDLSFRVGGDEVSAEVKFDKMAARTGNIAIEYWNSRRNKKSGLLATTARLWVHVIPSPLCVYVAGTESLFEFVCENKPLRKVEGAGDGNASLLLYKASHILPAVFVGLDVTSPEDLPWVVRHLLEANP